MAHLVKISHEAKVSTVALFEEMKAEELNMLLQTVFGIENGSVVGFLADNGLVIPLSLAIKSPTVLPSTEDTALTLLVSSKKEEPPHYSTLPPPPPTATRAEYEEVVDDAEDEQDEEESVRVDNDSESSTSRAMHEILRFVSSLRAKGRLDEEQSTLLEEQLFEDSRLLFAAYSVAVSFKDAKYFSEICLDIASSLQTEDGRDTCIAQDEVLQCCDKLYLAEQITQNQLLYLRHLVLIRTESIWDIHDNYSATEDFQGMSQALHQLANAHHGTSTALQQEESEEGFEGDSEDDEDEINGKQTFGPSATSDANESKTILKQMVDYLYQSGEISENECRTLLEMIANDNEYCLAAFEVWGNNKNLEDFEDTLKRCAKLEIRKQQALSKEEQKKKTQRQQQYDESSEESSENSGGGYDNDEEDGESAEEEDEPSPAEIKRANADLGVILASLGLTNQWEETVPMPFVSIVFIATHRNVLQLGQAKALCDLYQAQYDLVLAAWEAYNIDSDARELIDTLKRIVRELTFDESGNITMKNHPEDPAQNQLHPAPVRSQESSTSSNNVTATSVMENEDLDKTNEDVIAQVKSAKNDLVESSLQMMVKKGLAAEAGANSLWQRYQHGDPLVNAAIEQYAESRDASEFLETIQLLSSLSQEEIDALMQNAADKLDEEGEDIQAAKKYQAEQQEEESESSEESDESDESSEQSKNDIEEPIRAKEKSDTEEKESEDEIASPSTSREPTRQEKAQAPEEFPLAALSELSQRDLLTPEEAGCLTRLVLSQDANILAVFDVFRDMQDTEDLIDSLKRIARLTRATQGSTPQGTPKAAAEVESKSNDESSQESMSSDESEESDVEPGQTPPLNAPLNAQAALGLPPADQKKVVQILANSGIFTAEQVAFLERLVDIRNPTISNLFITHERERNVEALIVGLMKALPVGHSNTMTKDKLIQSQASVDVSKNQQQAESEESEESEEDESADSDDSREEIDSLSVEKKFLENIRNMSLSHLNTAALRLAIARNDPAIREALENYRTTLDDDALTAHLKTIAQSTTAKTLKDENINMVDDEEMEEGQESEDSSDDFSSKESDESDDEKDYEDDFEEESRKEPEDEDAEAERAFMKSKAAHDHVFPILVSELVQGDIVSRSHGERLLSLYQQGNNVVSAALDVYDTDQDMKELVDTLQRLVVTVDATPGAE